jgi:hypothetical protein
MAHSNQQKDAEMAILQLRQRSKHLGCIKSLDFWRQVYFASRSFSASIFIGSHGHRPLRSASMNHLLYPDGKWLTTS